MRHCSSKQFRNFSFVTLSSSLCYSSGRNTISPARWIRKRWQKRDEDECSLECSSIVLLSTCLRRIFRIAFSRGKLSLAMSHISISTRVIVCAYASFFLWCSCRFDKFFRKTTFSLCRM